MGPTANLYNPVPTRSTSNGHKGAIGTAGGLLDDDEDDALHTFTAAEKRNIDSASRVDITSLRGWANALMLVVLLLALV
jgi:hypothetical protein